MRLMEKTGSSQTDKKHVADTPEVSDETEEGEVDDCSDQEENVSDPPSDCNVSNSNDHHSSNPQIKNVSKLSSVDVPKLHKNDSSQSTLSTVIPSKPTYESPSNFKENINHIQHTPNEKQITSNHTKHFTPRTSEEVEPLHIPASASPSNNPLEGLKNLEKVQLQMQLALTKIQKSDNNTIPYLPFSPPVQTVTSSVPSTLVTSESNNCFNSYTSWQAAVPSSTSFGSQHEIINVHAMYQQALQLCQRVSATIGSTQNVNIQAPPFGVPVVPSSSKVSSQLFPNIQTSVCVPDRSTNLSSSTLTPLQKSPQDIDQSSCPATMISNQTHLPDMQVAYSLAYSAAYQETIKYMSSSVGGSLVPNTPEYASHWHRSFNYYLNYYLQAHNFTSELTNGQQAVDFPLTGIPKRPLNDESSSIIQDATNNHDFKRSRLSPGGDAFTSIPSNSIEHSYIQNKSPGTSDGGDDNGSKRDLSSSRCVWISNVPQGVRALDVKEMCSPYGKVQSIKIVKSKKSRSPSIFAYLIMETSEAAVRLVQGLQGVKYFQNELKVKQINAIRFP
uniref:RRM domain-containing protein n=2 Tax=Trichobilharzia regenti TaxID=157069 RepID=A0AA85JQD8_TRIRE|nr:unnamed protein product [Trichobilharzia regenti]